MKWLLVIVMFSGETPYEAFGVTPHTYFETQEECEDFNITQFLKAAPLFQGFCTEVK